MNSQVKSIIPMPAKSLEQAFCLATRKVIAKGNAFHMQDQIPVWYVLLLIALLAVIALLGTACSNTTQQNAVQPTQIVAIVIPVPSPDVIKTSVPNLDTPLNEILAAFRANDSDRLKALAGERHLDLKNKTVRVILEMDIDPQAHPAGLASIETITLPDGRTVQIQHAPPIAIRADLAQAIAATGATYETAFQNSVQVLAPFDSLQVLSEIPGVRLVRLPYPTQP